MKTISASQLQKLIEQDRKIHIVDVLPEDQFERHRLPGAINLCIYEIDFLDKAKKRFPDPATPIVLYGLSETYQAAPLAFATLKDAGFTNLAVLEGGLNQWINNGYSLVEDKSEIPTLSGSFPVDTKRSVVRWVGRNLWNQHHGTVALKSADIELEHSALSGGRAEIDLSQIACDDIDDQKMNQVLINHLRSADFFLVSKYPTAVFELQNATPISGARPGSPNYEVNGTLSLRGHKDELLFDATLGWNEDDISLQAHFDIDRTTWGSTYGSGKLYEALGKHLVNDNISLSFQLIAPRK